MSVSDAAYIGPPSGDWAHYDATYGPLLNGTAGTLLAGAKLTAMRYKPPGYDPAPKPF